MSFSMQTEEMKVMAQDILGDAKVYLDKIQGMQSSVNSLGSHWTGDAYNNFKTSFEAKYARCVELYEALEQIASGVEEVASEGATVEKQLSDIMNGN